LGHVVPVKDVYLSAGVEFLVFICAHTIRIPRLLKIPAANHTDVDENNEIVGLF
jgi:formate--tetrahydrofolate ligase